MVSNYGEGFSSNASDLRNAWHHLAVFYNVNTESGHVFLDGVWSGDGASVQKDQPGMPESGALVGHLLTGSSSTSGFRVDELRVSRGMRYDPYFSFTPPQQPLSADATTFGLWHFDEPAGATRFDDASANDNWLDGVGGATTVDPLTYTFYLEAGWNLIGLPLVPDAASDTIEEVFPENARSIWRWHRGAWRLNTDPLKVGVGYCVYSPVSQVIDISGATIATKALALNEAGWHLVSPPLVGTVPTQDAVVKSWWGWGLGRCFQVVSPTEVSGAPPWHVQSHLFLGHSYWVYLKNPGVLRFGD